MIPNKTLAIYLSAQLTVFFLLASLLAGVTLAATYERPDISKQPYPRAFFFRNSEGDGVKYKRGKLTYTSWSDSYQRLGGIMGKVLEEEVPGRAVNREVFTRFKKEHPNQLVLLHYNGNSRDPRDLSEDFFSGHWIYYTGTIATRDLPAEAGESDIYVKDTSLFSTQRGRYKNKSDDIGICLLDTSGKPNWLVSEQVQLVSINHKNQTIRVKRGSFNTVPLHFPAGRTYVAAHVTTGPWGKKSNLLWTYNFSTHSPRNSNGLASFDVLAEDIASQFLPGGNLAAFDGIEFDVMHHYRGTGNKKNLTSGLDMDADGKADWGYFKGINTYGLGVIELVKSLRKRLGEGFIILADGTDARSQRAFQWINGIESEGWPNFRDSEINDWSSGMNRHRYWANFARKPIFNYINHKFLNQKGKKNKSAGNMPYSTHRLVIGAAQLFDAFFTYSLLPPADDGYLIGIWDELRKGKENKAGWLGFPKAEAINLAKQQQNLLAGKPPSKLNWQSAISSIRLDEKLVKVEGRQPWPNLQFHLKNLPTNGQDLTVAITMRAATPKGYPEDVPRLAWVGLAGDEISLINEIVPETGMKIRGQKEQPIDPTVTKKVRFVPKRALDKEVHAAYFSHPPFRGKGGYTFWQREVDVPQNGLLTFYTGLSKKAKTKSDGVTYKILLKEGKKDFVILFDKNIKEWKWQKHRLSLSPWANKKVILKFVTDSGPQNNAVADHAHWGDAFIQSSGPKAKKPVPPAMYTTFVGEKSFESTFYFRDVQTAMIDLAFKIEGSGPVWIERVDVYPAPEAFIREFDYGLVLVNPSDHSYSFDLTKLVDNKKYKRLMASKYQDVTINDGSKIAGSVIVGSRDSLFLIQENLDSSP